MKSIVLVLVTIVAAAVAAQPGFDPEDVVRQMRGAGHLAFDDGEFLVDTSIAYAPAPRDRDLPAVAFDGTNWLVVWRDGRGQIDTADIYGARVTQAGVVLDPLGITISTAANDQWAPAVAFDGTSFLVVWTDKRSGNTADIYGARVTQAGVVLDSLGIAISTAANDEGSPAVAFDGTNLLVVWDGHGSVWDGIYGARVTQAGVVLDPNGINISRATSDRLSPSVAFDGTNSLVVWTDYRSGSDCDIYVARVTRAGVVIDPSGIPVSTAADGQCEPAVAFGGSDFLVVWEDNRGSDTSDVYGARVTPGGVVLDPSGIPISTAAGYQGSPTVAFDGTDFLAAWTDKRVVRYEVYGARVTPGGIVLDPSGLPISTAANSQRSPAVAFGGTNFLAVWKDWRGFDYEVYGARVTQAGSVLDSSGIPVSTVANTQELPAVSFDGTNFLAVWTDSRNGPWDIYGARITQAGVLPDSTGIAISTAANDQRFPALAFDGTNFLAVWTHSGGGNYGDIYGARVTQTGAVLEPNGIAISAVANSQLYPSLTFDGTSFLVVWEDHRSGGSDIYGARVTRAGVVLDTSGIPISTAANDQRSPAVTSDGTNSLVVWTDQRSGGFDIYGARVTRAGLVLEPTGIPVSAAANGQGSPAIAYGGANYLVVWSDQRGNPRSIYGARVTPSGSVLDPTGIPVSTPVHDKEYPTVAFGDTSYLVVWTEQRSAGLDIYGARVSQNAVVFDSGPVVMQEGNQVVPALARGTGSQLLLVYQGWADTAGGTTYNTDRIWGMFQQFVGVQEAPHPEVRTPDFAPSIVRGVLHLPPASGVKRGVSSILLDVSGRKVLDIHPGPNSTEGLAPGIYFLQSCPPGGVRRVVLLGN